MRHVLNIDLEKELEHKNTNDMLKDFTCMYTFEQSVSKHVQKKNNQKFKS